MSSVYQARMKRVAMLGGAALVLEACSLITSLDGLTDESAQSNDSGASFPQNGGQDSGSGIVLKDALAPSGNDSDSDAGATGVIDSGIGTTVDSDVPDTTITCPSGQTLCGSKCVDLTSDPANCGKCANACSNALCGSSISASLATSPSLWTFNGSAQYNTSAPSAELTIAGTPHQAGTFVYNHPIAVDSFDVQFDFRIGLQGGTRSDGMGFMLEKNGAKSVGGDGSGLGMTGLTGFGVELDIYQNTGCSDVSGDHVGVDLLTTCSQADGTPNSISTFDLSATTDLGDTHWHTAKLALVAGAMTVTIDSNATLSNVALAGLQQGTPYYFGFAGATGGLVDGNGNGGFRQEVKNVTITFPTPHCL